MIPLLVMQGFIKTSSIGKYIIEVYTNASNTNLGNFNR